jgi:hypothetical protein
MSDEHTDLGQGEGAPQDQQTDVAVAETPPAAGQEQPFLHTWKTRDEAEQGVKDLQRILAEERSRADKLQHEQLSKLTELVEKASAAPTSHGPSQEEIDARLKTLSDEIDEAINEGKAGGRIIDLITQYGNDIRRETDQSYQSLRSQIEQRLIELDPDVASADKQKIAQLQEEFGIKDRKVAAQILKKMQAEIQAAKGPQQPPRPQLPGNGITAQRTTQEPEAPTLPPHVVAALKQDRPNISESELKELAARLAAKKKGSKQ